MWLILFSCSHAEMFAFCALMLLDESQEGQLACSNTILLLRFPQKTSADCCLTQGSGQMAIKSVMSMCQRVGVNRAVFCPIVVVDEERMRPGHWWGSVLCVFFSAWHCWLGGRKDIRPVKYLCQISSKILFQNRCIKNTEEKPDNPCSRGKLPLKRRSCWFHERKPNWWSYLDVTWFHNKCSV